ncbi:MAG: type II toxin-antitoxin system HicB family antitoxin [Dehalococcoidia bacterium]|nr:type II toxin-antitoxin system HicB family antitoxin [Dehalococcoidia bacterium]
MSYRYDIILYWSEEDEAFIAEVPDLPGCVADGPTYEDALAMIQEVMDIWIKTQKEMGHPIPEPKGRLMFA